MGGSGTPSGDVLEQKRIHLQALKRKRDEKREELQSLFRKYKEIQEEMKEMEHFLMSIDDDIDRLQDEVDEGDVAVSAGPATEAGSSDRSSLGGGGGGGGAPPRVSLNDFDGEEPSSHLDDLREPSHRPPPAPFGATQPEEYLPEPSTQSPAPPPHPATTPHAAQHPNLRLARGGLVGQLNLVVETGGKTKSVAGLASNDAGPTSVGYPDGAFDTFFQPKSRPATSPDDVPPATSAVLTAARDYRQQAQPDIIDLVTPRNASTDHHRAQRNQHHPGGSQPSAAFDPNARFRDDRNFPWSARVRQLLQSTFRLTSFRDHQKEIIHATLSGEDVFVVMRTGGGKSLTYQLPALLEGRGPQRKVTFVVSPLLSLIQDQESQMNEFAPGSAVSFSSNLQGRQAEHARRWALVRDPDQGVCLVLITPEKIGQSKKLQTELEKLSAQGRLGRFVIDECHCASQWGHDFRPDYTKLGVLKRHFPNVPCIAVTATASDKVRDDVCDILRLGHNYRFFRSSANRPNLTYGIRPKRDGKDVVTDMVSFIKEHHPRDAGIVYTFSKKDADTLADQLCEYGVVARSYHSDVTPTNKEHIHSSWMRNETQVVVATIAFGLGINKPDVRFVLHHTISKTLDAYYQESGRAGRDGNPADCVLYYSPKDVPKVLKMVHGTSGEDLLWPMVRYAQSSSSDAVCRAILMSHLGEPTVEDMDDLVRQYDGTHTEPRNVGRHCQTVCRLLAQKIQQGEKHTMQQLLKEWRSKSKDTPQCVLDFPPSKDNLSVEECERIIVAMLIESVFEPNIVWTAYDSIVYLSLGPRGMNLWNALNPTVTIRFPIYDDKKVSTQEAQKKTRKTVAGANGWVAAKPKAAAKRKKASTASRKVPAKKKSRTKKQAPVTAKRKAKKPITPAESLEVIELSDDDDDGDVAPSSAGKSNRDILWESEDSSDDEFEFDG